MVLANSHKVSRAPCYHTFVTSMATDSLSGWAGPPASYVLFVLRADALDVTYGTPEGFEKLGIPYMAQIKPDKPW